MQNKGADGDSVVLVLSLRFETSLSGRVTSLYPIKSDEQKVATARNQ